MQRFRSERLRVRSRRSATFTPSAHVRRQSLPVWSPTLNKIPLPLPFTKQSARPIYSHDNATWEWKWLYIQSFFKTRPHVKLGQSFGTKTLMMKNSWTKRNENREQYIGKKSRGKRLVAQELEGIQKCEKKTTSLEGASFMHNFVLKTNRATQMGFNLHQLRNRIFSHFFICRSALDREEDIKKLFCQKSRF